MVDLRKPWLFLNPETAHWCSHFFLKYYGSLFHKDTPEWSPLDWRHLHFKNPLGIAGGVDKNSDYLQAFWSLGCGFVEVGTVTPQTQIANPGAILKRDVSKQALWNKMGFPNQGVAQTKAKLQKIYLQRQTPIFVNVGKNRATPNESAIDDYLFCIRELRDYADVFVVNVSSPNTKGLRELLKPESLKKFLTPIVLESGNRPVLLKLSPDIPNEDWIRTLDSSIEAGISGWVISNTTTDRTETPDWPEEGGVSGLPLKARSEQLLRITTQHLGENKDKKLIVSAGGVSSSDDINKRLKLGAHLIQVYSALIFEGPQFFRKMAREMKA